MHIEYSGSIRIEPCERTSDSVFKMQQKVVTSADGWLDKNSRFIALSKETLLETNNNNNNNNNNNLYLYLLAKCVSNR